MDHFKAITAYNKNEFGFREKMNDKKYRKPFFKQNSFSMSVKRLPGQNIWRAKGPDEAQEWIALNVDLPGNLQNSKFRRSRALYRGQEQSSWALDTTYSIQSELAPEVLNADDVINHFGSIVLLGLLNLYSADILIQLPPLHPLSGIAAARHYGFPCRFMDWSSNYSTAFHFATKNANQDMAAVWWIYPEQLVDIDVRLIISPPYLDAQYLQRGVFIWIDDKETISKLNELAYKIEFPANHHKKVRIIDKSAVYSLPFLELDHEKDLDWYIILIKYCCNEGKMDYLKGDDPFGLSLMFENYVRNKYKSNEKDVKKFAKPLWQYLYKDSGRSELFSDDNIMKTVLRFIQALIGRRDRSGKSFNDTYMSKLLENENPGMIEYYESYKNLIG